MNKKNLVFAIDFDGTIVEDKYPEIGKLRPGAKRVINKLYEKGHTIIIWTCRCNQNREILDKEIMIDFLLLNKIKYHKINDNPDCVYFGCYPKIYYNYIIDDKQIGGLPNWEKINNILRGAGIL